MSYIALLLPSVFGLKVFFNYNKINKKIDLFIYYLLFVLFSNLMCLSVLFILNKDEYYLIDLLNSNNFFTMKYIYLSVISNFILSNLFTIIIKNFTFNIEVEYEEKKSFKKNHSKKIIQKKSFYYDNELLGSTYYEMQQHVEK